MSPTTVGFAMHRSLPRRTLLQVGCSALVGLGLPAVLARRARAEHPAEPGTFRSVILVFLPGGPSHIDTFDPKPAAPAEIRGPFGAIDTAVPGIQICEHLPKLAARIRHLAVVRSMSHALPHHDAACFIPCGIDEVPPGFRGFASRGDWPCFAAALDHLRPRTDGLPSGVSVPRPLKNGPNVIPGVHAGFLGPRHDPLQVDEQPNGCFQVEGLNLTSADLARSRLDVRRTLLESVERLATGEPLTGACEEYRVYQERALAMLATDRLAGALAIDREPADVSERYGRHEFGRSLLLARRLVEAGVPVVQANLGVATEWDTHYDNAGPLKRRLLPRLDQALAALVDDLDRSGQLSETLVVVAGEFGRTPKIGDYQDGKFWPDGRGHWSHCFSAVLAGGGVAGGQVIGGSDKIGAYPASEAYRPSDLGATIYTALGLDPASPLNDPLGRPLKLNAGRVIDELYTGRAG